MLVDSEPISNRVLTEVLEDIGLAVTYEQAIDLFLGRSWSDNLIEIKKMLRSNAPSDLYEKYSRRMFNAFEKELLPVAGIRGALDVIINEICDNVCVASSGSHEKIRKTLSLTGLYSVFEGRIFSASDVEHGKPEPDLFLKACCELESDVATTVVIEDTLTGVQAAITANIKVLAYTPQGNPSLFKESGATPFSTMSDLPDKIRSL